MGNAESKSAAPISHQSPTSGSGCPVPHSNRASSLSCPSHSSEQSSKNQMPTDLAQKPLPGQTISLDTARAMSSIPTTEESDSKHWVYPSEQMFFDAMRRKNWNPNEIDMKTVVPIHNAVNERAWAQILEWERQVDSSSYVLSLCLVC